MKLSSIILLSVLSLTSINIFANTAKIYIDANNIMTVSLGHRAKYTITKKGKIHFPIKEIIIGNSIELSNTTFNVIDDLKRHGLNYNLRGSDILKMYQSGVLTESLGAPRAIVDLNSSKPLHDSYIHMSGIFHDNGSLAKGSDTELDPRFGKNFADKATFQSKTLEIELMVIPNGSSTYPRDAFKDPVYFENTHLQMIISNSESLSYIDSSVIYLEKVGKLELIKSDGAVYFTEKNGERYLLTDNAKRIFELEALDVLEKNVKVVGSAHPQSTYNKVGTIDINNENIKVLKSKSLKQKIIERKIKKSRMPEVRRIKVRV